MAEHSIDVLMRVVGPGGPMAAESSSQFRTPVSKDELTGGFNVGFFCELRSFDFEAGVEASLQENDKSNLSELEEKRRRDEKIKKQEDWEKEKLTLSLAERAQRAAARVDKRQAKAGMKRSKIEKTDMQPVGFTRVMDTMTVPLFAALVNCETLPTLSVVKRKAANARQSGDGYLRLDFENVLITKLDWKDEDHLMIETGQFIYRKLTLRYRPQNPDGSLGVTVSASWEMKPAPTT